MNNKLQSYLAFLRGINVGGNNIISMGTIKDHFEMLGFTNVKSFGNSGNIIFTTTDIDTFKLETKIESTFAGKLPFIIDVFVRSIDDIKKVVDAIPSNWANNSEKKYDIIFLRKEIDSPKIIQELKPDFKNEELFYHPGVLFWSIDKDKFSKSNIPKIVKSKLYKSMTIRTPNVVRKVLEIMRESS